MLNPALSRLLVTVLFLLASALAANGQCYTFSSGTAASLSIQFTNVPSPTVTSDGFGGMIYSYGSGTTGNATLTIGNQTLSAKASFIVVTIAANPNSNRSSIQISTEVISPDLSRVGSASLGLLWAEDVLPNGNLPSQIPPSPEISHSMSAFLGVVGPSAPTITSYVLDSLSSCSGVSVPAPSTSPAIQSVVNGASFQSGLASGSWSTIVGTNLSATTRGWANSDFSGNNLPTSLDKVQVTVNGKPAYISYISPTQINFLSPDDTTVGQVPVQVVNSLGTSSVSMVGKQATAPSTLR